MLLKDWSRHQTWDGSRDQSQHQRGHGQQEERSRRADRVVAYAQVGDDGTDEEQDEADCGGRHDQARFFAVLSSNCRQESQEKNPAL
jgi:hypothetical protein